MLDDIAALSNIDDMLAYFERPDIIARLRQRDPLNSARIRGLRRMVELLGAEDGVCTAEQFARISDLEPKDVEQRRNQGQLLGFRISPSDWAYPIWQTGPDGLLPGLSSVMAEEPDESAWGWMAFFLAPNVWLDGARPLDVLRQGDIERVRNAARLIGEQVAA